ncbi:MAG: SH3 domain-containing protein, partial [Oscillospiraceae bacterium]|nr:SH3 domain-containing protein [Oscillospiraceae bacterium]
GRLNIRSRPALDAPILTQASDGTALSVINQWQNWYLVRVNGVTGYASSDFVTLT